MANGVKPALGLKAHSLRFIDSKMFMTLKLWPDPVSPFIREAAGLLPLHRHSALGASCPSLMRLLGPRVDDFGAARRARAFFAAAGAECDTPRACAGSGSWRGPSAQGGQRPRARGAGRGLGGCEPKAQDRSSPLSPGGSSGGAAVRNLRRGDDGSSPWRTRPARARARRLAREPAALRGRSRARRT